MKKQDEMTVYLQIRSQALGFKVACLLLALWTLYESAQVFITHQRLNIMPMLILLCATSAQRISELALERKMILGDEEYHEPNKLLWTLIAAIAICAVVISAGTFLIVHAS